MTARRKISMALVLLVALGFLRTAAAGDFVPFKLRGEGQLVVDPMTLVGTFTVSGVATHLGAWTAEGGVQLLPLEDGFLFGVGEITFTAANGDELRASLEGTLELATGFALVHYTVDGGTGRFRNATGQFDIINLIDEDGSFSALGDGWISRPQRR